MKKSEVLTKIKKHRNLAKRGLSAQYDNTLKAIEFYNGDTMSYEDRIQFMDAGGQRRRATVQFNKVQPNVDSVAGFMAQNRRQAKALARLSKNQKQQLYSKNMNALYDYHRENQNADQIETDQDLDMLINGYGATDTDLSYIVGNASTMPGGEILKMKLDPRRVYWNPMARAKNLLDSSFAGYWEDYDLMDALDLFQGSTEEDFETIGESSDETGYTYNPYGGLYDKIRMEDSVEWATKDENLVRVYNHQWMEYETFYRAENPIYTAQSVEDAQFAQIKLNYIQTMIEENEYPIDGIESSDMFAFNPSAEELTFNENGKRLFVEMFGDMIKPVPFKRKCFYTAIFSGKHIFKFFKNVSQQGFSIKFKTGTFNASALIWTGMVNAMMEPAEYHNKALTELMFTIAANSKGGVMIEEDAVEDINDFSSKWAQTDAVITVNSGSIAGQKIMQKTQGAVPTGLENIVMLSAQSITDNGVDPAFLGKIPDGQESGILYKRRIRQIISKMAKYFDSGTLYQKEDLRLHLDLIPIWMENNNGEWVRITGEDGAPEFVQITQDMTAPEYDVTIQEAPQSTEDKQETAMMLTTMGDKLAVGGNAMGASAFYAESLNLMQLDGDIVGRLSKVLQPQDDMVPKQVADQMQARIQELESELSRANVEKLTSEAEKNRAMAQKTMADIPKVNADTVKSLEEARRTAQEVDIISTGNYETANVSI